MLKKYKFLSFKRNSLIFQSFNESAINFDVVMFFHGLLNDFLRKSKGIDLTISIRLELLFEI